MRTKRASEKYATLARRLLDAALDARLGGVTPTQVRQLRAALQTAWWRSRC